MNEQVYTVKPFIPLGDIWLNIGDRCQAWANAMGIYDFTIGLTNLRSETEQQMLASFLPANKDEHRLGETIPMAPVVPPPGNPSLTNKVYSIELLAANLERGLYAMQRASMLPASEQRLVETLAAWHNKGIVTPEEIAANYEARSYAGHAWNRYTSNAKEFINEIPKTP